MSFMRKSIIIKHKDKSDTQIGKIISLLNLSDHQSFQLNPVEDLIGS